MKTRSIIIVGLTLVIVIFGVASFIQWDFSLQIRDVSEYHRDMSIPAITILTHIKMNFQMMHMATMQMIQGDPSQENYQEFQKKYQKFKVGLKDNIQKYNELAYAKNSENKFLATEMMQITMKNYATNLTQISNAHDIIFEQFKNGEVTKSDTITLLELSEGDFHNTIEESTEMEIDGMNTIQEGILGIENKMAMIFVISGIIASIVAVVTIIITSRFVSKPISSLIDMTNKIATGNFVKVEENSKNSDVNEILQSLNKMSDDLREYKSRVVMQEKLSSVGELSSRMAHDIRNPLTVIKASLDIMKSKKELTGDELEKFKRVDDAMKRILHQVDNVLDFVKGKPMSFSQHSLQKILNSAIQDIQKPENIEIETTGQDVEIECDFEAIKVVLINIIFNSIQVLGNHGKIKITTQSKKDDVIIEIEDSGPGIPEDKLEKIFEPLYTTKQEGTGLGLASCKSLIEQHGGKISVKNNPTRFIIKIPQEQKNKIDYLS